MRWSEDQEAWERLLYLTSLDPATLSDAECEEMRDKFWKANLKKNALLFRERVRAKKEEWCTENFDAIEAYRKQHNLSAIRFSNMVGAGSSWLSKAKIDRSLVRQPFADHIHEVTGLKLHTSEDMEKYKEKLRRELRC